MNNLDLIVQGQGVNQEYKAKLGMSCVQRSSFILQWEKNSTYQIQFTAINDGGTGYELLTPEASLFFMGQEFLIKQIVPDYSAGLNTKAITATHVYSECQWFRKDEVKNGVLTYTPQSIMSFIFDGNPAGFTYEVIGNFASAQIENFGNVSGKEALAKIIEVWPDAIIFPDNKLIKIYQHDSFIKNLGHRLAYLHNSSEVKLTYDSTNISNQVWCIGKTKDKAEGAPDNAPTEYYFPPFMVTNEDSVQKWTKGIPHRLPTISDDRFTDANSMKTYALSQLSPEPTLTVEVTKTTSEQPIPGEMVRLEIKQDKLTTDLETVGFSWHALDRSQPTQVTLNNTAQTIFDYQNSLRNKTYKRLFRSIADVSVSLEEPKKINNPQSTPKQPTPKQPATEKPKNWSAGGIFVDTSSNNGALSVSDMQKFKNKGVKGIICKLTEGTGYTNPLFGSHKENAINAGLKFIGTYHLFHGDPVNEANYFLKNLQANNVDKNVLVIADIENTSNSTLTTNKAELTRQIKQFYDVLINAGYTNTCDYASSSWFASRFDSQGKYRWIANYSNAKPNNADAWQFTSRWNGLKIDASYSYNPIFV